MAVKVGAWRAAAALLATALLAAVAGPGAPSFAVAPSSAAVAAPARGASAEGPSRGAPGPEGGARLLGVAGGAAAAAAVLLAARRRAGGAPATRTSLRYTTAQILPSLAWLPFGCKGKDLANGEIAVANLAAVDVVVGKTPGGKLFAVADKCPPTGTSLCYGGEVDGDCIVDPQYGTKFNVFTGLPEGDWCPSPPVIGGLLGTVMGGPQALATFEVREAFLSGDIEVQVDTNTRKAYEAEYWKGILDAQGKNDGTFY